VSPFRAHDRFYRDLYERHPLLATIGGTALVELDVLRDELPQARVFAKCEHLNPGGSLKDRPVLAMLAEALREGRLEGRTIIDSSSGNAGIAYAMIGAILGVPVELVVPGNASRERRERILAHGARLVTTDPVLGYDEALREAHRRVEAEPERYFHPDQYANEQNWRAHFEGTAVEILEQLPGGFTHFVAGVGTGGALTGIGRRLKEDAPDVEIVQLLPDSFPGIEGLKPLEAPEDIVPEIFDPSVVDARIRVSIDDAYDMCHRLARRGPFCGQSSGAALHATRQLLRDEPTARVVMLLCDLGERYFSTRLWER
jgi:cysteine synthase B